jgi:hypothetical protein
MLTRNLPFSQWGADFEVHVVMTKQASTLRQLLRG